MSPSERVSCILFHGPTAQGRASTAASDWGRIVATFGHPVKGLDVETARAVVVTMACPPVGDKRGSVVVGPVDILSQSGVLDVLLKTLEEFDQRVARPYLWAWDVGSVSPTIRSRCLTEWCPGQLLVSKDVLDSARTLVDRSLAGDTAGVIETLNDLQKSWKDDGADILRAVAVEVARRTEPGRFTVWSSVRALLVSSKAPSFQEAVVGLLP